MKTKIIIALIASLGTLGLMGCKPKETTITGQVFIATSSGANVRLGAVKVQLIDEQGVTDDLQQKAEALAVAKQAVEESQIDYDLFLTSKFYLTNSDYIVAKGELDNVSNKVVVMEKELESFNWLDDVTKTIGLYWKWENTCRRGMCAENGQQFVAVR